MATSENYTAEMVEALREAAPLSLSKARELAGSGLFAEKSHRSIIAKARSAGIEYQTVPKPAKRVGGMTKPDMVAGIAAAIGVEVDTLDGLDKATATSLNTILKAVSS